MTINSALLSTSAALIGSAVGATATILSNYVLQRGQTKRELLNHLIAGREELYSSFIVEAARLHAHSLTHSLEKIDALVDLHALVSRIRFPSSDPVVVAANTLLREIVSHYGEPNISLDQTKIAALLDETDPLSRFSVACRLELADVLKKGSAKT